MIALVGFAPARATTSLGVSANTNGITYTQFVTYSAPGWYSVNASGGSTPYTYSISPALPTGLQFDSTTGGIYGTPTVVSATTTYTVTVTDATSTKATTTFPLNVVAGTIKATTTSVSSSLNPATYPQNETFTATVTSTSTVGESTVSFTSDGTTISGCGAQPVSNGTATCIAQLAAGSHSVVATFAGDANFLTSSSTLAQTVNSAVTATQSIASTTLTQNHAATNFTPVTGGGGTAPRSYSVSPALPTGLNLDASSGAITGSPSVTHSTSIFTVTVSDANSQTASNTFEMTVNSAVTATQSIASATLTQNHATTSFTPVTGGGGTGTLSYSVSPSLPTGLGLNTSTGAITGTPSVSLSATTFTVTVTDANSAIATNSFSLTVNGAVSATQAIASTILTQNHAVTGFTPVTGSGGTTPLSYGVSPSLPTGLGLNTSTGAITGTPSVTLSATTFTVTVTDANSATATNSFSLTVNGAVTATQAVASAILTQSHAATSFTPVTGGGGTGTLSYSVSPSLPTSLSLNTSTGAITGTPSVSLSTTTFTVTVTDSIGATASNTFSLTVNSAVTANQAVASTTLIANSPATSFTPVTGGGGAPPLSYSVSPALPTGLSMASGTGAVTGTPTVLSAATSYTVTVTDANSATATATFSLTVSALALTTTQAVPTTSVVVNSPITPFIPVNAAGGFGTVTFALSGATLPTGLSFDTGNGQISGAPTALLAATQFTVTATDSATPTPQTSSKTFSLAVTAPALTTTQAVPTTTLTVNAPATPFVPVTASGGFGTIAFALSGATLPNGLSFNTSTGQITGTPTVASAATVFTVTATDSATPTPQTSSKTFSLTVNKAAPGLIVTSSPATALYGAPVTFTATLSGGDSPTGTVTFKVDGTPVGTSPLSGATATFTTKTIAAGAHTISAVYNGDANNAVVTNTTTLTVTARPNPANDPDVRGVVAAQVNAASQFAHTQIDNTVRRLEQMHDEDDNADDGSGSVATGSSASADPSSARVNGASAAAPFGSLAAFAADPAGGSSLASVAGGTAPSGANLDGGPASLGADPFSGGQALGYADPPPDLAHAPQSQAGLAIQSAAATLPSAFEALDKTGVLPFHVWSAGSLTFGLLNAGGGYDNRFDSAGVTVGFDGKVAANFKAGVALGFGFDHAAVGSDGTASDARSFSAALYSSWRVAPHSFVDLIGGYGTLHFDSQRWSSAGGVMLSGVRTGGEAFGSLGFTQDARWQGLKLSAYGRLDAARIVLDSYQESGSSVWALSYGTLETTTVASVVGARVGYPIAESWGALTPSARFEYTHEFAGGYAQGLNYADLAGSSGYVLNGAADWRDTLTAGLGLRAENRDQLSLDFEYLISGTPSQLQAQEFRLAAKQAF